MTENEKKLEVAIRMQKELIGRASSGISNFVLNLSTSASLQIPKGQEGLGKLLQATDILSSFNEAATANITVYPRKESSKDKQTFVPGEHKGVSVVIVTTTNEVGTFNVYGGLRDPQSAVDEHDSDITLRQLHAKRTELVLDKGTCFNFHVRDKYGTVVVDLWFIYKLAKGFTLSSAIIEGERLDLHPTVGPSNRHFQELKNDFYGHINTLISLIPSN